MRFRYYTYFIYILIPGVLAKLRSARCPNWALSWVKCKTTLVQDLLTEKIRCIPCRTEWTHKENLVVLLRRQIVTKKLKIVSVLVSKCCGPPSQVKKVWRIDKIKGLSTLPKNRYKRVNQSKSVRIKNNGKFFTGVTHFPSYLVPQWAEIFVKSCNYGPTLG